MVPGQARAQGPRAQAVSRAARERAKEVAADPRVQLWIGRLKEVARDMPLDVHVLVASGTVCVLATDGEGRSFERGGQGGLDQDAMVEALDRNLGRWDGGDR